MRKNRKGISVLAGFMACVMAMSMLLCVAPGASAKTSAEIKKEIDALKEEREQIREEKKELQEQKDEKKEETLDVLARKDEIDREMTLLMDEQENINLQIQTYSLLIAEKQNEVDAAQARYDELNEKNKQRIRAMEESGKLSFWSVLLKATSFADLLDRMNLIDEIAEADQRRLAELDAAAKEVIQAREELAAERDELEEIKNSLLETQAELEEKRAESDRLVQELKVQMDELEELYKAVEDHEAEMSAKIAQQEKEYNEAKAKEQAAQRPSGGNGGGSTPPSSSGWRAPCAYTVQTSPFGWRTHPIYGDQRFHNGVDLANVSGTPIYAARAGTVTVSTYESGYGNYCVINHGDGFSSLYAHMTNDVVSVGQTVAQGQLIGYMGSTGASTGPHLHFGVSYNGSWVNPRSYF